MIVNRIDNGEFYRALDGWDYDPPSYPGAWTVEGGEGYWIDGASFGSEIFITEPNTLVGIRQPVDFSYADLLTFDLFITYTNPGIMNFFQIRIDGEWVYKLNYLNQGLRRVSYDVSWLTGIHNMELVGCATPGSTSKFNLKTVVSLAHPPPPTFYPKWNLIIGPL